VSTAKAPKNKLKQTEGMKAFFINDPSRAMYDVRELKDIDIDMSGTIDQSELMMLSTKKISLKASDKLLEVLSTHPNVVKRIKHLASLTTS
jgi:heat shock protein HtpX